MLFLHIFIVDKFTQAYIDFINKNFNSKEHFFLLYGNRPSEECLSSSNVWYCESFSKNIIKVEQALYNAKKVYFHSLFLPPKFLLLLYMQFWLLKKSSWVMWGGDLYWYSLRTRNIKYNFHEIIRSFVIKNMGGLITQIKGDYDLARLWYGAKGKYYYSFMYPSNLYKEYDLSKVEKDPAQIYIQVGNSADPTNNHIEVFNKLQVYKDAKIKIICPLSYGSAEYREKVIEVGNKIFGDKFQPITDFMPFENYLELLAKIDIAIFNHKRQQAVGNITTLLGLGKKVYIREDITTWEFCTSHNLKVYPFNGEIENFLDKITEIEKNRNVDNIKLFFSEKKLLEDLQKIFNSEK